MSIAPSCVRLPNELFYTLACDVTCLELMLSGTKVPNVAFSGSHVRYVGNVMTQLKLRRIVWDITIVGASPIACNVC